MSLVSNSLETHLSGLARTSLPIEWSSKNCVCVFFWGGGGASEILYGKRVGLDDFHYMPQQTETMFSAP